MNKDVIFQPLKFRNLTVKNRLFRSSISGRWDNYNGSGNLARINWETKFARGGIGAIISSFVPVHIRGRILPNYAMIDHDDKIAFWRGVGRYNVFEPKDVGFVSQGPEAQRNGFRYETWQPGNSNQGHLSGTQLSDRDKDAVLEHLKTL
jgi:NADH:flavin oxidoreductase / NADH oxidase family